MKRITFEFKSWDDLKKYLEFIREELEALKISSKKITQILKNPGVCSNEELIILAEKLKMYPYTLMEFGLGTLRISEAEERYHKQFFTISKHYEQLTPQEEGLPSYLATASG